jgi:hypothetical protein
MSTSAAHVDKQCFVLKRLFSGDTSIDQYRLPHVPVWAYSPSRYLDRAWHASSISDDGMREYLAFASPAEFASRNIFTGERPLRRARAPRPPETESR